MMSSPSPTIEAQGLHENLLCIGDAAFLGYQIKDELNELKNGCRMAVEWLWNHCGIAGTAA